MKQIKSNNFRSPVYRVYAHLTDDERIDLACELLAKGVLRLAEKRGLLKCCQPKDGPKQVEEKDQPKS